MASEKSDEEEWREFGQELAGYLFEDAVRFSESFEATSTLLKAAQEHLEKLHNAFAAAGPQCTCDGRRDWHIRRDCPLHQIRGTEKVKELLHDQVNKDHVD